MDFSPSSRLCASDLEMVPAVYSGHVGMSHVRFGSETALEAHILIITDCKQPQKPYSSQYWI